MQFTLKIQRYNPDTEQGRLQEFTVDGPETATLLDVLDVVKDTVDGSVTYRKSCRMAVCGSCGMRMDGAAVLACKTPMAPLVESGHVPVISPMGNLPVVKDLVVDMEPFWDKFRPVKPWLEEDDHPPVKEWRVQQEELDRIMKEALCIQCGCCVSECNSMESDPDFLGPAALAKAQRFVGDVRDRDRNERLRTLQRAPRRLGLHPLLLLQRALPQGRRPARRDRQARRRDLLRGHAVRQGRPPRAGVRRLDPHDRLPARDRARALHRPDEGDGRQVRAADLARAGKVPNPLKPHRAKKLDEVRKLHKLLKTQEADARDDRRAGVSLDREEPAE